jgi:hypothetical protein
MESSSKIANSLRPRVALVLITGIAGLWVNTLLADTYRWKDKEGKVHYGAAVPAEYADQPYDILNDAGIVIDHIEDTSIPMEIIEEKRVTERQPLISAEERRAQRDKLLVIQYQSEDDITAALELEVSQLGYDRRLINQSFESINASLKEQISLAANQQRANQTVSEERKNVINKLYRRRNTDEKRLAALDKRESDIRARFQADLERYRFLTTESQESDEEKADQG